MAALALRNDEKLGLGVAVVLHAALLAVLLLQPKRGEDFPLPERMTVTLSDDVALTSTSPEPMAAPAPDLAPELGEAAPEPQPVLEPEPAPALVPKPVVAPKTKAPPQVAKAPPKPPATSTKAPPKPSATPKASTGGSKIGDDFLKGVAGSTATGTAKNPPAAAIGPAVRSALAGAISRELKPKWAAPQGVDADKLVTILAWDLNPDGSLAGAPRVVRQEGITDANRAQAQRHAEQAVRAVRLAQPFDLPSEYYSAWKRIADFRFDRKLSQ